MIHYHGTPCGATREDVARFAKGRHMLVPFVRPEDIATVADVSQSFCVDNGAFTAWKQGVAIDWDEYFAFVLFWHRHPGFDWAIIPDVIDGTEAQNDQMIEEYLVKVGGGWGVPVWHMHESLERLQNLCGKWPRVAIGSSGQWPDVGTDSWWCRMDESMEVCCDDMGRPLSKLHGLRMLDPEVFTRLPLASADSTNAVRNSSSYSRFGMYCPPNASTRMAVIAERIEAQQSAPVWVPRAQMLLNLN